MYMIMYIHEVPRQYSIAEARSQLAAIIDRAEAGGEVELTRRGQPVAVVISHQEFERLRGRHLPFGEAYRKFLDTHDLEDIGVDDDFARSSRDRTAGRRVSL